MSWTQVVAYAVGTSALIGVAVGMWKLGAALAIGLRRLARFLADWFGEEPDAEGNTKRPGVLRRLDQIESGQRATREEVAEQAQQLAALGARVARIEKELHPNGGGTFRDRVEAALSHSDEANSQPESRE